MVLMRKYSAAGVAEELEQNRATLAHLAPLMVQELVAEQQAHPRDHTALRLVQYASGPMPLEPLRRALDVYGPIFMQVYGMTETGLGTILHPRDHCPDGSEAEQRRLQTAGQASPHFAIRVVDDAGRDVSAGEMGEVLISGPSLMQGYWRQDRATADTIRNGWMHTGDIGSLDEDGFLTILDRKKDIIISGGENIYPRDVEEALYRHDGVAEAAVIGVPDERWGEAVKAFVVLRQGATADEAALIEHCRLHIASYKKPKSIEFVAEIPRLPNKKIDKKALRAPFWKGRARNVN
jgi:acyl-CoA synthetase (AMP-forming)/AMP-acid ligase II